MTTHLGMLDLSEKTPGSLASLGISVHKTAPERHPENFDVQEQGPVLDIIQIMLKALLQRRIPAPTVDLSPARHTGLDAMPQHVARNALTKPLDQDRSLRTWSHQAHLALAHV